MSPHQGNKNIETAGRTPLEAELLQALRRISDGYGPDHLSRFAKYVADAAIAAAEGRAS